MARIQQAQQGRSTLVLIITVAKLIMEISEVQGRGHHPPGAGHRPRGVGHHKEQKVLKVANVKGMNRPQSLATVAPPCSSNYKIVKAYNQNDFSRRLLFPSNQTVRILVMNNITLNGTLWFNSTFSCTWILNGVKGGITIRYPDSDKVAVIISQTHNIVMQGINVEIKLEDYKMYCPGYPQAQKESMCAALVVRWSYGIQIVKARVQGRVEVKNAAKCKLDHLKVVAKGIRQVTPGAIVISYSGIGPQLVKSGNVVSNCDVSSTDVGITMLGGAVGNIIANNYVRDFSLFGISCGYGVHSSADCMLNEIKYNRVYRKRVEGYNTDSAGIYFNVHWWGPGNVLTCNYVEGPGHCYYFDFASSGITVNGGVCIDNNDGFKINSGKQNVVKDVILVKPLWQTGFVSCQNYDKNNCLQNPGMFWDNVRSTFYNTSAVQKAFPAWNNFCDQTSFRGKSCNPSGSAPETETGKCSGIPTGNDLTLFSVENTFQAKMQNCQNTPVANDLNFFKSYNYAMDDYNFNSWKMGDYGISNKSSPVYKSNPNFISCPSKAVGIQVVKDSVYSENYNVAEPTFWQSFKDYMKA